MRPSEFWDSTFGEIGLFLDGARAARRDQYNNAITTAWHAAAFVWSKQLPKLEKVLLKDAEPQDQEMSESLEAYIGMWRAFFAAQPYNQDRSH